MIGCVPLGKYHNLSESQFVPLLCGHQDPWLLSLDPWGSDVCLLSPAAPEASPIGAQVTWHFQHQMWTSASS